MDAQPLLSGPRAASVVGLTYRQVDYLARSGTVEPTVKAKGSGSTRGYGPDDVALLIIWRDLYNAMGRPVAGVPGSTKVIAEVKAMRHATDTVYIKKGHIRIVVDVAAARRTAARIFDRTSSKQEVA